jgi:hypothetical protein
MPPPDDEVTYLSRGRVTSTGDYPFPLDYLGTVVRELGHFRQELQGIPVDSAWSARHRRCVSTALLLRLSSVERWLRELGRIRPASWPDTAWAMEMATANHHVERNLGDLLACLDPLVDEGRSPPGVDSPTAFTSSCLELLKGLERLQNLVTERYPEASRSA